MDIGTGLSVLGSASILKKLLGPTADYVGDELKEITRMRVENLKQIFANATKKVGDGIDKPGAVPPKVLYGILSEGSFCDDLFVGEYMGGVLASSSRLWKNS